MIKLQLSFKDKTETTFDIIKGETLYSAVERVAAGVPRGDFSLEEIFNVVINGNITDDKFWKTIILEESDNILITPKIKGGDTGQLFKQALIMVITLAAYAAFPPAGAMAFTNALIVTGISIGATLALNALIPPPVPDLGSVDVGSSVENSQMYSVTGQSNQAKRLGGVPKVYGTHRMYPPVAANPYVELAVDPKTGETIQYLTAIYDFGLGSPIVTDLKIGETLLSTESFIDFEYRFVDPNRPDTPVDDFDQPLNKDFKLYQGDRSFTQLSLGIGNGSESVQVTANNPNNFQAEIGIDFVCPTGLYGYSSGGDLGDRRILLNVEFALVGTNDWKSYNDISAVDYFRSVGGTDLTDFTSPIVKIKPSHALFGTYYTMYRLSSGGSYNTPANGRANICIKPLSSQLLVPKPGAGETWQWNVGAKVFYGRRLLGSIATVTDLGPTYPDWMSLTLDRSATMTFDLPAFSWDVTYSGSGPIDSYIGDGIGAMTLTSSRHSTGVANITGQSASPVYANFKFSPKTPGQYKVRVRRTSTDGAYTYKTADDLTWGGLSTRLLANPIATTKRHVFLELKIRATDQINGQIQNLSGIVSQPVDVYDSETETWSRQLSNNPAWVFCDLLTSEVNKKAVPKSRLHLDSIVAWAEYCETIPTPPPGQEYLEPRFQTNFILDYDSTLQEVLQQVTGSAQASLNITDGKYGVLVDRLKTTPVQIFTPRNSKDFSSSRFYAPRPHGVKVKYIDPQLGWEVREVVVYDNGFDEITATEFDELTSFACTNYEQAWRFGRYMIAQNRLRQETMSLSVDFENLICSRGDYVQITQDVMQIGGRPARVKGISGNVATVDDGLDIPEGLTWGYTYRSSTGEIKTSTCTPLTPRTFELDGDLPAVGDLIVIGESGKLVLDCIVKSISPNDDLSAQITLVERANEIFDYESESVLPDYDPQFSQTSNPDLSPPRAVENLTLRDNSYECANTQSGYNYFAEVVWDTPQGSVYELFEIWANDGRGYHAVGTTVSKYYKYIVDQARLGIAHGIKVVAVSASGKKLELVAMPSVSFTPTAKTVPPSNVSGFGMSITSQVLQLAWSGVPDCDVYKYEIRYSPETNDLWETSVPLQTVDRNVNSLAVQARTGIYFIKAVDFAGNKSTTASTALTTIPNLFDLNVIETVNEAPTFPGFTDKAEKMGNAIILQQKVFGDVNTVQYHEDGYYTVKQLVDLGEIYSARLQSLIRADGYRYGELMSSWEHLSDVSSLSTAGSDDWNIVAEYRATTEILSMSSWLHLSDVEHLNEGLGQGFTAWRPIPTIGDATGRVFQFRVHLQSITPNVTPRLFDGTIKVDMPDRVESFENLTSSDVAVTTVNYSQSFIGPGTSPNVQISIDGAESGDYWVFSDKTLEGFGIRFYDDTDTQVVRQFDVLVKGYGKRHSVTI